MLPTIMLDQFFSAYISFDFYTLNLSLDENMQFLLFGIPNSLKNASFWENILTKRNVT